jgi:hypothetical protein
MKQDMTQDMKQMMTTKRQDMNTRYGHTELRRRKDDAIAHGVCPPVQKMPFSSVTVCLKVNVW